MRQLNEKSHKSCARTNEKKERENRFVSVHNKIKNSSIKFGKDIERNRKGIINYQRLLK